MGRIIIPYGGGVNGVTSEDLTAQAGDVLKGKTFMGSDTDDEAGTGTLELTGNAGPGQVLSGYGFYSNDPKNKLIGTIPSYGGRTVTPGTSNQVIAAGNYISGNVTIAGDADLIAANIKKGKNIFGVAGSCKELKIMSKTVNISSSATRYKLYNSFNDYNRFYQCNLGNIGFTPVFIFAFAAAWGTLLYSTNGLSALSFNLIGGGSAPSNAYGWFPNASLGSEASNFSVSAGNLIIPVKESGTTYVDIAGFAN